MKKKIPPNIDEMIKAIDETPKGQLHPMQIKMLEESLKTPGRIDQIFAVSLSMNDDTTSVYIAEHYCEKLSAPLQRICVDLLKKKGKVQ